MKNTDGFSLNWRSGAERGVWDTLVKHSNTHSEYGTERTRRLLDKLGAPDKRLKIIHIAGSDGKGSIAEYITQILLCAGKKTGTFTSPAVFGYEEQFRIDGVSADTAKLKKAFAKAIRAEAQATQFEAETAVALLLFAEENCEYAVVECGLGGLYDATNAVLHKEIALIGSICLEHTGVLGNTITEICTHKAGIIKDCPAVISALQCEEARSFFAPLGKFAEPVEITRGGFVYGGKNYETAMLGEFQAYNASVAVECAKQLKIPENAIYSGVKRAYLRGRLQVINKNGRTFILDGAHNPASFKAFSEFAKSSFGTIDTVIYGSFADKDVRTNLSLIKGVARKVFAVTPSSPRAMDAREIADICGAMGIPAEIFGSVEDALERSDGVTAAVGTFFILGDAYRWIEKRQ